MNLCRNADVIINENAKMYYMRKQEVYYINKFNNNQI